MAKTLITPKPAQPPTGSFEQAYGVNGSILPDPDVTTTKMLEAGIL
jgi:hypothetical protein